jgi:hypothetical protein
MRSGGAALMAVQVLVDHGVPEEKVVLVTCFAGRIGLSRLTKVFPDLKVVVCTIVADYEERVRILFLLRERTRCRPNPALRMCNNVLKLFSSGSRSDISVVDLDVSPLRVPKR